MTDSPKIIVTELRPCHRLRHRLKIVVHFRLVDLQDKNDDELAKKKEKNPKKKLRVAKKNSLALTAVLVLP